MTKRRQYLYRWISGLMLLVGACTQQPAPVEDLSGRFYGHDVPAAMNSPYHGYASGPPHYVAQSSVPSPSSVGVSDLPPPGTNAASGNSQMAMAPPQPTDTHAPLVGGPGRFIWPVAGGKVISHFGTKPGGRSNEGINIAVSEGEPVWAAADGMVVYAGDQLPSYGNMIVLRHDSGWATAYAHMRSISVKKNDYIKQGEIIGYVGMTGSVKTPQLHFAVRNGKTPVDPERYLPGT